MTLRYGIGDGRSRTLLEVGKKLGISRERVRQLEAVALKKIRSHLGYHSSHIHTGECYMSDLFAARAQMGTSLAFHIIFASLGVGLPLLLCIAEGLALKTRNPTWMMLTRRWE